MGQSPEDYAAQTEQGFFSPRVAMAYPLGILNSLFGGRNGESQPQQRAIPDINTIRNGSSDAKALQQTLKDAGLYKCRIDGILGKGTREAYNQYVASKQTYTSTESESNPQSSSFWNKVVDVLKPSTLRVGPDGTDLYKGKDYTGEFSNEQLDHLDEKTAQALYQSAVKHPLVSTGITTINHLIPGNKVAHMSEEEKDQLAVLLTYYGDRINQVDNLDDLFDSETGQIKSEKLSKINYGHEGFLATGKKNVGVHGQNMRNSSLSRVLGMFGVAKDKDGNYYVNDGYDNEIYRIPEDYVDKNRDKFKGATTLQKDKAHPGYYLVTRDDYDTLRKSGVLPNNWFSKNFGAIGHLARDIGKDIIGKGGYDNVDDWSERWKLYGENALDDTGRTTNFNIKMSDAERRFRVARVLHDYNMGYKGNLFNFNRAL